MVGLASIIALLAVGMVHGALEACGAGFRGPFGDDDGFGLHLLTDPRAVCLDGSPGGFYLRPGRGDDANNFIVENEGGGWCVSAQDCLSRLETALGSSKGWPPRGCPGMDGGSNGMLSSDCSINPFCNYSMVHLNYCDGASFSGDVAAPVPVLAPGGKTDGVVFYRGRAVLDASIAALLELGMSSARTVVWKGCSAGGLSVFLHADYVHARLPAAVRFVAMPDGGFFLDSPTWTGAAGYTPLYQWVAAAQNVSGSVNGDCVRAYAPLNETWKCFMAQYTLPYIRAPLYVTQDLNDIWQLENIARLPAACTTWPQPACTTAQVAFVHQLRFKMLAALAPLFAAAPASGGFLTTCLNHCHQNIDSKWLKEQVSNQTLVASFASWLAGGPLQPLVVDDMLGRNPTCVYGY